MKVASAGYKQDVLSIVTDTFHRFLDVLRTKQGENESYKNFETRFDAQVCKLNATCDGSELPSALVAFLLLANSRIDAAQRVSILSAAAPIGTMRDDTDRGIKDILSMISYSDIASVVRACDEPRKPGYTESRGSQSLGSFTVSTSGSQTAKYKTKKRLTPEQLAALKAKSTCRRCGQVGHWASDVDKCKGVQASNSRAAASSGTEQNKQAKEPVSVSPQGTMKFNMASLSDSVKRTYVPGPLVDDGAPYSGMGIVELRALAPEIMPSWDGSLEPIPEPVCPTPFWQYGNGNHASAKRKILGSVVLSTVSDQGTPVEIRHLIIEGSSQWVVGRNVTRICNINHMDANCLEFCIPGSSAKETMTMVDVGDHSFLPYAMFCSTEQSINCTSVMSLICSASSAKLSWYDTKAVIDKVHKHVCGHSSFEDIKLLLERNGLWSAECGKYLAHLLESCRDCDIVKAPKSSRKVSLRSMSRGFNEVVNIDHFFLENLDVLHFMDSKTRYSNGSVVPSTSMHDAIPVLDTQWISEFWPPGSIQGDKAFENTEFKAYLSTYDIAFRPVPPRRHSKNVLESKHRILRDIYLRLKAADPEGDVRVQISKMFRISNDLYGSNVASAHELAKGYTRPALHQAHKMLPDDIRKAQEELSAKRKMNLILKSKSISETPLHVGDLIQVFTKLEKQKRGTWSTPKTVLSYDIDSRTVTVPGAHGRTRQAAIEDVRLAVVENELAQQVQDAIDVLSQEVQDSLDAVTDSLPRSGDLDDYPHRTTAVEEEDFVGDNQFKLLPSVASDSADKDALTYIPANPSTFDPDDAPTAANDAAPLTQQGPIPQGRHESTHSMRLRSQSSAKDVSHLSLHGYDIELLPGTELSTIEQDALKEYYNQFKTKEFLLHHTQGLPSFVTENSYAAEEKVFRNECQVVHFSQVPRKANIIRSHVLYKIKMRDDGTLTCKARIAPHGNEDREKDSLRTDSESCPPLGIRILFSICALFKWYLTKIDVKSAFLQSGSACRDVYVVPPKECKQRQFIWLLNVATYGLVNANVKWQKHSDETFSILGLCTTVHIPQLFYMWSQGILVLVVVKIVDDILVGGPEEEKQRFIEKLSTVHKLGTITHLPGSCLFFGLQLSQSDDYCVTVHADHKLNGITPHKLSNLRRKQGDETLNAVELFHFNSVNGSIGFVGVQASLFAAFASSYLQQKRNRATVKDFAVQSSMLRRIIQIGSLCTYKHPSESGEVQLSVLVFTDAARPSEYGQLGTLCGILVGTQAKGSVFHVISWNSHLSHRPVKSIPSAEVLAAGSGIEDGIMLAAALFELLHATIPVVVAVDSKDLFESLTSCHVPEDKAIRADIQLIRYYFETRKIHKMVWVPGSLNLADPLTKKDSRISESLQLLMFDGFLPFSVPSATQRCSQRSLG